MHTMQDYAKLISIRAPTRGATVDVVFNRDMLIFQSALPRGERRVTGQLRCDDPDFNPRSHEGSDTAFDLDKVVEQIFQSALPRGERPTLETAF